MYVDGTAARDFDVVSEMKKAPKKKVDAQIEENRRRASALNLPYVLFLTAALIFSSYTLIHYLQVRAEMVSTVKNISSLESKLNKMTVENDERENAINSSIDLDEIKRIAIEKLGMVYAQDGQVITYSGEGNDYVLQSGELH